MPQLDTVAYFTQYVWTLILLFSLFPLLINVLVPKLQQQLAIRTYSLILYPKKETTKMTSLKILYQQKKW